MFWRLQSGFSKLYQKNVSIAAKNETNYFEHFFAANELLS